MILKVNDTKKHNISMNLDIDWDNREITINVSHWNKEKHETTGYGFEADEFGRAIEKFDELERIYVK